jgi:putative phosphoesterase
MRDAAVILARAGVETVVHCGDITSPQAVKTLAAFDVHWVLGNCDWDEQALRAAMQRAGHTCHGLRGKLEIEGRRIAFSHGHRPELLRAMTLDPEFDLVLHGHTHVRSNEANGGPRVLCPGALHHANPPGFAMVSVPGLEVEWVEVS